MLSSIMDRWLTGWSARPGTSRSGARLPTRHVGTPVGPVRVHDSGSAKPCVLLVPDGPNVIEHCDVLIDLLSARFRVVCFDMPGFGFSRPDAAYVHSLDQGAAAVLGVMDSLAINTATLAFSCANGFYALRAAQLAPQRVSSLMLSQTPSLTAMHAWTRRVIPRPLRVPVIGQLFAWLFRRKAAAGWYPIALPRTTSAQPFQDKALAALADGGCFCLAGVVQGLGRESMAPLVGVTTPCTMIWGTQDHSHRHTDPLSLHELLPDADIVHFTDCGHFPDVEQPERFAALLMQHIERVAKSS